MIILVTYDLKAPGKDYTKLYEVLKTAPTWWHYLESTWILRTDESVQAWSDKIRQVMDPNDLLLVVDVTNKTRQGWLNPKAWEWLKTNDG